MRNGEVVKKSERYWDEMRICSGKGERNKQLEDTVSIRK